MRRIIAALAVALLSFIAPAKAQVFVNIVTTCGTIPGTFPLTPGKTGSLFIDTNGNLCTGATFTPSGTQNVNVTQILGAAPSLTNPLWVSPATGATFPVSGAFWPYTLGQQLAAASVPVVLTAAQLATLTPPAAITNYALETGGNLATVATNTGTTNTNLGAPGATACSTDTASCSLNQLLQRIAQRISSLITALGSPFQAGGSIGNTSFAQSAGPANVTATACSATVVTGGSAVNAFTAQTTLHGFTIANIDTTEPLWISFTGTAAASGTDSYPLPAATATTFAGYGSFTAPPGFGLNHALSVVAATNGHKFSCTWW
jgi:hypothetical protein